MYASASMMHALKNILVKVHEHEYDGVCGYVALLGFYDYILIYAYIV